MWVEAVVAYLKYRSYFMSELYYVTEVLITGLVSFPTYLYAV